jgi:chaperonin GroEL (HSP60 family)
MLSTGFVMDMVNCYNNSARKGPEDIYLGVDINNSIGVGNSYTSFIW